MAEEEQGGDDKQHDPTPKKLEDARRKGEVPRSTDLTTAAAYGGFILVALSLGGASLSGLGNLLSTLVARADTLSAEMFAGGAVVLTGRMMGEAARHLSPWFLVPAALALVSIVAQRSFTVSPDKLAPKLNRISPIANAKNKFGRKGLFEFAKSFGKLTIFSVVLGLYLWRRLPQMIETIAMNDRAAVQLLFELGIGFFSIALLIAGGIGGVDFLWQRQEHQRRHRMSHKELQDEVKQSEGDPHMKQQRRQRGYDIATNRMLADVPKADVIIVNPRHFAVALSWSRESGAAPVCVAKGIDEIAARIREAAMTAGVPIHRDPPTARAIHATVEIGHEILPEQYKPVAAAIRFAENMRKRAGRRHG